MYLLDTNVITEIAKPQPAPQVIYWLTEYQQDPTFLSVITIGEIRQGIERLPASKRRSTLTAWLDDDLLMQYADFVLPINLETMNVWGNLTARLIANGKTMQTMDSLIAALGLQHDLTIVTRNISDFGDAGVKLVNPWDS